MPDNLIYSNDTTLNHPIAYTFPASVISFNEAVTKENSNRTCTVFDSTWKVIDLDAVELQRAQSQRRNRTSTCDNAVGVFINTNPRMLLIEYKLNIRNTCDSISQQELDSKVAGSIALLSQSPAIYKTSYIVFSDRIVNQAYNKLRRFKGNRREYIAVTIRQLKELLQE
jgi:hypothetical protein